MRGLRFCGAGWITFDPTNREDGGCYNLIPLAVGRVITQVMMPMTGTFLGMTDAYLDMSVNVEVKP